MGNSLRCFLACVFPCGAFDLIRVVHINGHVEEYSRQVSAGEVLRANPNHVLSKPCSQGGGVHRIIVVSPDSDLKRGNIYFLIPKSSLPEKKTKKKRKNKVSEKDVVAATDVTTVSDPTAAADDVVTATDAYLTEIVSEKRPSHRRRSSVRVGVWRPHLQSISEDI